VPAHDAPKDVRKPIDVATGELWDEKTDLSLSGPFGLSLRASMEPDRGERRPRGTNWLHNYSASLDVSGMPSSGNVTYWDERGMPYYFTNIGAGKSSYDNLTGSTLALSSDGSTYTLTTFSSAVSSFNTSGQLLTLKDRSAIRRPSCAIQPTDTASRE